VIVTMTERKLTYPYERALSYALWLLGQRMRTKAELRERLAKKGALPEDVERVIMRLEDLDYLDDASFAEAYVSSRKRKKGRLAISRELAQKGISGELREAALEEVDEDAQLKTAGELIDRNRWRWSGKPQARAKAFAFLARRGFPAGIALEALDKSDLKD
jgi:regulatory protein